MRKTIIIDENVVSDIQKKDIARQVAEETLKMLIDSHSMDNDASFMQSPVFKACQEEIVNKRIEWENAKNNMIVSFVMEDIRNKIIEWNLNYGTNELVIEI